MIKNFLQFKESFVPKNIEKRKEDLKKIKEEEAKELEELAIKLSKTVKGFKDLKVNDEKEQFFIDKFVDCKVKVDHKKYLDKIFFFDKNDKHLGEYGSKYQHFWTGHQIWSFLESKYGLNHEQIKKLSKTWIEENFKLKTLYSSLIGKFTEEVEEHFKLRSVI